MIKAMEYLQKRYWLLVGFFIVVCLGLVLFPQSVFAGTDAQKAVCDSLGGCPANDGTNINNILRVVLNILSFIAGVIAVIMIIISGIKFMTSQGDSGKVSSARNTIIYALIGILIVLLSQAIVQFVLNTATTVPVAPVVP